MAPGCRKLFYGIPECIYANDRYALGGNVPVYVAATIFAFADFRLYQAEKNE